MGTSDSQPCNQWHRWQPGLAMASETGWFVGSAAGGLRLPQWLSGKECACSAGDAGDTGSIPGLGRSPGEENGSPLQYSCLENPMGRGVWWCTVHRVMKNWPRLKQLSTHACVGPCAISGSVRITWNGKTPSWGCRIAWWWEILLPSGPPTQSLSSFPPMSTLTYWNWVLESLRWQSGWRRNEKESEEAGFRHTAPLTKL